MVIDVTHHVGFSQRAIESMSALKSLKMELLETVQQKDIVQKVSDPHLASPPVRNVSLYN